MVRYVALRNQTELDELEPVWSEMVSLSKGSVFQSWPWVRQWCALCLGASADGRRHSGARLEVGLLEDGAGRILAIAPLVSQPILGPVGRIRLFIGQRLIEQVDVLSSDPDDVALTRHLLEAVRADLGIAEFLHLRGFSADSVLGRLLAADMSAQPRAAHALVPVIGGRDAIMARVSKSRRKSIKSAINHVAGTLGPHEASIVHADRFPAIFDRMVGFHHAHFQASGRTSRLVGSNLDFLREIAISFRSAGLSDIVAVEAGGRLLAANLVIRDGPEYHCIVGGVDPEYRRLNTNTLVDFETQRLLFDTYGPGLLDLGCAFDTHKQLWRPFGRISLYANLPGRSPLSWLLSRTYDRLYRRTLGEGLSQIPEMPQFDRHAVVGKGGPQPGV